MLPRLFPPPQASRSVTSSCHADERLHVKFSWLTLPDKLPRPAEPVDRAAPDDQRHPLPYPLVTSEASRATQDPEWRFPCEMTPAHKGTRASRPFTTPLSSTLSTQELQPSLQYHRIGFEGLSARMLNTADRTPARSTSPISTIQISTGRLSQANVGRRVVRAIGRLLVRGGNSGASASRLQDACSPAAEASAYTGLVEAFQFAWRSIRREDQQSYIITEL